MRVCGVVLCTLVALSLCLRGLGVSSVGHKYKRVAGERFPLETMVVVIPFFINDTHAMCDELRGMIAGEEFTDGDRDAIVPGGMVPPVRRAINLGGHNYVRSLSAAAASVQLTLLDTSSPFPGPEHWERSVPMNWVDVSEYPQPLARMRATGVRDGAWPDNDQVGLNADVPLACFVEPIGNTPLLDCEGHGVVFGVSDAANEELWGALHMTRSQAEARGIQLSQATAAYQGLWIDWDVVVADLDGITLVNTSALRQTDHMNWDSVTFHPYDVDTTLELDPRYRFTDDTDLSYRKSQVVIMHADLPTSEAGCQVDYYQTKFDGHAKWHADRTGYTDECFVILVDFSGDGFMQLANAMPLDKLTEFATAVDPEMTSGIWHLHDVATERAGTGDARRRRSFELRGANKYEGASEEDINRAFDRVGKQVQDHVRLVRTDLKANREALADLINSDYQVRDGLLSVYSRMASELQDAALAIDAEHATIEAEVTAYVASLTSKHTALNKHINATYAMQRRNEMSQMHAAVMRPGYSRRLFGSIAVGEATCVNGMSGHEESCNKFRHQTQTNRDITTVEWRQWFVDDCLRSFPGSFDYCSTMGVYVNYGPLPDCHAPKSSTLNGTIELVMYNFKRGYVQMETLELVMRNDVDPAEPERIMDLPRLPTTLHIARYAPGTTLEMTRPFNDYSGTDTGTDPLTWPVTYPAGVDVDMMLLKRPDFQNIFTSRQIAYPKRVTPYNLGVCTEDTIKDCPLMAPSGFQAFKESYQVVEERDVNFTTLRPAYIVPSRLRNETTDGPLQPRVSFRDCTMYVSYGNNSIVKTHGSASTVAVDNDFFTVEMKPPSLDTRQWGDTQVSFKDGSHVSGRCRELYAGILREVTLNSFTKVDDAYNKVKRLEQETKVRVTKFENAMADVMELLEKANKIVQNATLPHDFLDVFNALDDLDTEADRLSHISGNYSALIQRLEEERWRIGNYSDNSACASSAAKLGEFDFGTRACMLQRALVANARFFFVAIVVGIPTTMILWKYRANIVRWLRVPHKTKKGRVYTSDHPPAYTEPTDPPPPYSEKPSPTNTAMQRLLRSFKR